MFECINTDTPILLFISFRALKNIPIQQTFANFKVFGWGGDCDCQTVISKVFKGSFSYNAF